MVGTMSPTLSLSMIVKNVEKVIDRCLQSITPFVDEVVIVDTGSRDDTKNVIRRVCPKARLYDFTPETHPSAFLLDVEETWADPKVPGPFSGKYMLADFGAARQFGLEKCTSTHIIWIDSDDILQGGEHLKKILADMEENQVDTALLNYDYASDGRGNVTCKLLRERIIKLTGRARWNQPIHEVIGPVGRGKVYDEVNVVHKRHEYAMVPEQAHRNLKVLVKWWERFKDSPSPDPRMLFYLAMEERFVWPEKAIHHFKEYCKVSGWDEERGVAHQLAGIIHEHKGQYEEAYAEYAQAALEAYWNPDGFFGAARVAYYKKQWEKCVEYTERGLDVMKKEHGRKSVLMHDPLDRLYRPYIFFSAALVETCQWKRAVEACDEGLKWNPDDPHLKGNKEVALGYLTGKNKQAMSGQGSLSFKFRNDEPLDAPSLDIPGDVLRTFAVQMWKRLMEAENPVRALQLLDSLPEPLAYEPRIKEARERTVAKLTETSPQSSVIGMTGIGGPTKIAPPPAPASEMVMDHHSKPKIQFESNSRLKIVIWTGPAWERWSPKHLEEQGIGGSETAAIHMGKELHRLGHEVIQLGDHQGFEGVYDGVRYVHFERGLERPQDFACDVFVCSRQPHTFEIPFPAKVRFLWVHDIHVGQMSGRLGDQLLKVDKIFCLSEWHKDFFLHTYPFVHKDNIIITKNGIDLDRFKKEPVKDGNRLIYASSPDRGLERLLELMPAIVDRVPDAQLHVYYGFENWKKAAEMYNNQADRDKIAYFERLIAEHSRRGYLVYHGRVNQRQLAEAYLASKVWAYPTWFTETYCQLPGALVFTKEGMKPIEEIKEGDLVLTHKGRFRRVTKTIKKEYDGEIFSIKRKKDFNPITVTSEHPLYVASFHKRNDAQGTRVYSEDNKKVSWMPPGEVRPDLSYLLSPKIAFGEKKKIQLSDYIDMPVQNGMISPDHRHPEWAAIENDVPLTEDFAYILGIFAAEGCVAKAQKRQGKKQWMSQIVFALNVKEERIAEKIIRFFGKGTVRQTSENGMVVATCNSIWANFLDITIGRRREKKIPSFIWDASREIQAAFVNGLFDGDGNTSIAVRGNAQTDKPYLRYTTISPSLAYGMATLLGNLGYFPGITFDKKRRAYNLNWTDTPGSSVQHRTIEEGYATRVKSIERRPYKGLVYNFEVEEDESYVTDRTIVHNCISAIEAQAAGCVPVSTVLAALPETVSHGFLIKPPNTSPAYGIAFAARVVKLLQDESLRRDYADKGREYAFIHHGWNLVAQSWIGHFEKALLAKAENPLPAFGDL